MGFSTMQNSSQMMSQSMVYAQQQVTFPTEDSIDKDQLNSQLQGQKD